MKKIWGQARAFGALMLACAAPANPATARDFPVFPPASQLAATLSEIRELRRDGQISPDAPAKIILHGGTYQLTKPIQLQVEDSGTETGPLVIEAAPGEHPFLSGGVGISGWTQPAGKIPGLPAAAVGKIWMTDAPKANGTVLNFRELWVNGRKAVQAREPHGDKMERLVAWDKTNQVAVISPAALRGIKTPGQLEMVVDQVWETAVLRVSSLRIEGTNALVRFRQPESKIEFTHPWPPVIVNSNYAAPFFLENAVQFLDAPGEWFEDLAAGKIYYWPRSDEDMATATIIAPAIETLVQIKGSLDQPVTHIEFKDIRFANTTWLRPSGQGDVPLQAGMFLLDARKIAAKKGTPYHHGLDNVAWVGRPPAAVEAQDANHISFEGCIFEHTAAAGLDLQSGTHDDLIEGCEFRDIGGNGIQLGEFSGTNVETHLPWNPPDPREICSRETIADNRVTECGREDQGSCGIAAGYVREIKIEHNDISNLPYTGISVGWGWTKMTNALRDNLIFANRIYRVGQQLGDLGGIYTLSAQPGTVIAENAIDDIQPSRYVPDSRHWYYIYLDEGSSFITMRDNWCPAEKFLRNANGPGNVWINNGPQVSSTIKNAAGLEPAFQDLLSKPSP